MTRKSIAIDMDEVLADTVGALIEDVNKRTDLGITYDMLDGKNYVTQCPNMMAYCMKFYANQVFQKLKVMAHAQEVVKN